MPVRFDTSWKALRIDSEPYLKYTDYGCEVFVKVETSSGTIDELNLSRQTLAEPIEETRKKSGATFVGIRFRARKTSVARKARFEVRILPRIVKDGASQHATLRKGKPVRVSDSWKEFTILSEPYCVLSSRRGYQWAIEVKRAGFINKQQLYISSQTMSSGLKQNVEANGGSFTGIIFRVKKTIKGYQVSPPISHRTSTVNILEDGLKPVQRVQNQRLQKWKAFCEVCRRVTDFVRDPKSREWSDWQCPICNGKFPL